MQQDITNVGRWLKTAGSGLVVLAAVFVSTAIDGGFGAAQDVKMGVFSIAGGIGMIGWILLAVGLTWHPETPVVSRATAVWLACAGIASATVTALWFREKKLGVPPVISIMFAFFWIILGGAVAMVKRGGVLEISGRNLMLGLGAALFASTSQLLLAPWERSKGLTEGPAQPLLVAAFAMLTMTT